MSGETEQTASIETASAEVAEVIVTPEHLAKPANDDPPPGDLAQAVAQQASGPSVPRWSWLSDAVQYVTMITAVIALVINGVGLWFVGKQLDQTNRSISSATLEQIYTRMHDINIFFVNNPELKPYFYEDMEISDPNPVSITMGISEQRTRARVEPLAEAMCDFFAQALIELKQLPPAAYGGWESYIKDVYRHSPAMRAYYHKNEQWYHYEEAARLFQQVDREKANESRSNGR